MASAPTGTRRGLKSLDVRAAVVETGLVKQVIARLAASGDARNAENDVDSVVRATGRPRSRRRFDDRPLLVFWEMTKACDLACFHCRASAQPTPAPDELSEAEGRALIDELSSLGSPRPILILTGGDCLKRRDLVDLVAYASQHRVAVAVAPSVTTLLNEETLHALRQHGVKSMSLSLDGADARVHDGVRGVDGHFDATVRAIATLKRCGFSVQVNTTVMSANIEQLADIAGLLHELEVDIWEVFFLIATGRGTDVLATTPRENEDICNFLVDASRYDFTVRTVEAPFFRRVAVERRGEDDAVEGCANSLYARLRARLVDRLGEPGAPARTTSAATRDGKGIIFVAANGDVYPSGFLPLRLGNVRERPLTEIYRDHPLLRQIRDAAFSGTCGTCVYAQLCGGSRARAYAASGDPLGSDPGCLWVETAKLAVS
ncbi:MAG: TIGR04053 family radical SAM/SPASM domain-containing protein [Acidimicrobiales bacterium]